jgi:1,4-alpha-glucan branching enzyme
MIKHGRMTKYSAHNMVKPVNFICSAPNAAEVTVAGDFNQWNPRTHQMQRQPDGAWYLQVNLGHGHHQYVYFVDGRPTLDPKAQGIARNSKNERVSMIAVS